ncbi:MAG TPA: response regulator [Thermoplasmatales archaeon]|nr:response regulator [Thermoplasmatales archaeon]
MVKIMVVDDSREVILSIAQGLKEIDDSYEVIPAESGRKCLEILETEIPDAILLDIMMPEMSGWEVYDKIRDNPKWESIPILFLTARTDRIAENAGKFLGDDYIEKPFDPMDLKNRIDKAIERRKKQSG